METSNFLAPRGKLWSIYWNLLVPSLCPSSQNSGSGADWLCAPQKEKGTLLSASGAIAIPWGLKLFASFVVPFSAPGVG